MKYRIHQWLDTKTLDPLFGIQAQPQSGSRYIHACATIHGTSRALIYATRKRAEEVMEILKNGTTGDIEAGLVS